jgi:demethylmenaquinone methyltransferase / 2-methoxy-6-polyprenyl-1,4-benzoquinol methylase
MECRRGKRHHAQSCAWDSPDPPFVPSKNSPPLLFMESNVSARSRHARQLFAGIAISYERVATLLSFAQDPRWRHALVAAVCAKPDDRVLDVATGTGMVARTLECKYGCRVIGLDQSADMLAAGSIDGRPLVRGQGERLPFADESFDHVTFTYLLRYVDDPAATLSELARVLRPGGRLATLEFGVPPNPVWRLLWRVYTRLGLPLAGRLLSTSWGTVGDFLGPSIEQFYALHPNRSWSATGEQRASSTSASDA